MQLVQKLTQQNVLKRVLWAYGIHLMLLLASFVVGYFFLPEGILRGTPITTLSTIVEQQKDFLSQFLLTIGFNLAIAFFLGTCLNLQRVNGFPTGYVFVFFAGIAGGLVAGTNSFVGQGAISPYTLEGWLAALQTGFLEFLGYTCIVAATVKVGLRDYTSWLPWKAKERKIKSWRDIRLSRQETIFLIIGILLILIAGYNETLLAFS